MAAPAAVRTDRETIARSDDHRAVRIWLRLLTCTQMIERVVRSRLRERFGTTLPRFDLMAQLERHPEGLKMNELSRLLMVTGGNVTAIVDQLEKEGLVERRASTWDKRTKTIALKKGAAPRLKELNDLVDRVRAQALQDIDVADLAACIAVMQRVIPKVERP